MKKNKELKAKEIQYSEPLSYFPKEVRREARIGEFSESEELNNKRGDIPNTEIKSDGYVVNTLEAVIWCVLTTKGYKERVLAAANLGEDTDTVAAISGGLAAALYGLDSIPCEWLDTLLRREYIEELCERAASAFGGERKS